MHWNYRILKDDSNPNYVFYGLYECYYEDGQMTMHDETPTIVGDTPQEVIEAIRMMLKDATQSPVGNVLPKDEEHKHDNPSS